MNTQSQQSFEQEKPASHTPGPWSCAQVWRGPEMKVHAECDGRRVALAEIFVMHNVGEKEANAHLIAAAPDLLYALTGLLDHYVRLVNSGDAGNWDPEKEHQVIAARGAIARAEGRA